MCVNMYIVDNWFLKGEKMLIVFRKIIPESKYS